MSCCRPLRGFDLVKDRDTGNSKGYGFCVYQVRQATKVTLKSSHPTLTLSITNIKTCTLKDINCTWLSEGPERKILGMDYGPFFWALLTNGSRFWVTILDPLEFRSCTCPYPNVFKCFICNFGLGPSVLDQNNLLEIKMGLFT